nr:MAG TPA: hypothetical protein [Caudoviricetes sp.]
MTVYVKLPMYASYITLKGKLIKENEDSYVIIIGDNKVTVLKGFVFADEACTTYFSYQDKYAILAGVVSDYISNNIEYPEFNRKVRDIIC